MKIKLVQDDSSKRKVLIDARPRETMLKIYNKSNLNLKTGRLHF